MQNQARPHLQDASDHVVVLPPAGKHARRRRLAPLHVLLPQPADNCGGGLSAGSSTLSTVLECTSYLCKEQREPCMVCARATQVRCTSASQPPQSMKGVHERHA